MNALFPDDSDPHTRSPVVAKCKVTAIFVAADFEHFWRAYPRKVAKASARKAWFKLKPSPELQAVILDAVARHSRQDQWTKDKGKFIPHPATWLNGERWEDETDDGDSPAGSPLSFIPPNLDQARKLLRGEN